MSIAGFQMIDLEKLFESPHNTRRHFDVKALEELTDSVRAKGVLTPLLARPVKNRFEIAAGHRRYRAAKAAGVEALPVMVRELNDAEFLEVLTIENLQREDIHPLDEANGYRELMDKHSYDVATIAAKVGKSESYVYQRVKLSDLIPPAQKLFFDAVITAGHAVLIARLSPEEQKEVISQDQGLLWTDGFHNDNDPHPCSVRSLALEIKEHLYLDLDKAPWKLNDTKLLPAAGPCTTCLKRTGASPTLFSDIKEKDICTDRKCFNQKVEAFMQRELQNGGLIKVSSEYSGKGIDGVLLRRDYEEIYGKDDRCKFVQKAIVVDGHTRGTTKNVCIDKACKKHHAHFSGSGSTHDYQAEQRRAQKKRNMELERRRRIFAAVMESFPGKLDRADLELIAKAAWKRQMADTQKVLMKAIGGIEPQKGQYGYELDKPAFKYIESASHLDLMKFMVATALGPDLTVSTYSIGEKTEHLLDIAKRYNVDADKITDGLKSEIKAKDKKKRKVQTSAKANDDAIDDTDDGQEED